MAIKLGKWTRGKVAKAVYERSDGLRIHGFGLIKISDQQEMVRPDFEKLRFYIKLVGGRPTRAMMHYANLHHPPTPTQKD